MGYRRGHRCVNVKVITADVVDDVVDRVEGFDPADVDLGQGELFETAPIDGDFEVVVVDHPVLDVGLLLVECGRAR